MCKKVEKSRITVFFQWFVAPEGPKVGSLKRRVRSQMRDETLHAVVARSTFRSQNVQNTSCSDHRVDYRVDPKSGVYSGFVHGLTLKRVDHNRPSGFPDAYGLKSISNLTTSGFGKRFFTCFVCPLFLIVAAGRQL